MSVIGKMGGTGTWLLTNEGRTDRRLMLPLFKTEVKIQRPRLPVSLGGAKGGDKSSDRLEHGLPSKVAV